METLSISIHKDNMKNPVSGNLDEKVDETTRESLSTVAMMSFYLCLFAVRFSHPFDFNTQGYYQPLLLALFAVFTFITFIVSTCLMIVVRARFNRMQIAVLLISASTYLFTSSSNIILLVLCLAMIAFLSVVSFCSAQTRPQLGGRFMG